MRHIFLALFLLCGSPSYLSSQDFSNKGKNFWLVYPDHVNGTQSVMGIYITSDANASGTIVAGSVTIPFSVTANMVTRKFLGSGAGVDATNVGIVNTLSQGIQSKSGIHITSDAPVVVYAHIIFNARSGASLILPVNVLGRDYVVPSYRTTGNSSSQGINAGFGQVTVVAPEPNTTIEITTVATTRDGLKGPGEKITAVLPNPGDVYQIQFQRDADISGTRVKSIPSSSGKCQPIAVFSSTTWTAFECVGASGGDNLFQQLFPAKAWGKSFLTAPFIDRPYDIIRVFINPDDPPTQVTKTEDGITTPLTGLTAGSYFEIRSFQKPLRIDADKPISVAQYMVSQICDLRNTISCGNAGNCPFPSDPEMVILNPIEQTINNITVFSAHRDWVPVNATTNQSQSNVNRCFLNIIIKTVIAPSFRINGSPPTGNFTPIPGTDYSYLQENITSMAVSAPVQNLKADSSFIAIAYGYGNYESYGYNAGTSVRDLSQVIEVNNVYGTAPFPSTCINTPFGLSIVLPYTPTKLTWISSVLGLNQVVDNPMPDGPSFTLNGKQVQRYKISNIFTRPNMMDVDVKLKTQWPTADGCGLNEDTIEYVIKLYDPPKAEFDFTTTGCVENAVQFNDKTTQTSGRPIIKYLWELGEGKTSNVKNPDITYGSPGSKQVDLTVITDIGCVSLKETKTLSLAKKPLPNFTVTTPNCPDVPITLTDASSTFGETISEWRWDEGDGTVDTYNSGTPRVVTFPAAGDKTFSLALKTNTGCLSASVQKTVKIHPNPSTDFEMPEVCIKDNLAQFKDKSKIADGSEADFKYQWDFETLPGKTDKNPEFSGFTLRSYQVKLTVTSNKGCINTEEKTFTINGAVPNPAFTIANANALCSNKEISLTNTSTVDFGKLSRLEIFWDASDPSAKTTDEDPAPGKVYPFKYTDFGNPATKNIPIRLVAYTGTKCLDEVGQTIVLNGSPQLTFSLTDEVCQESPPFDMTGAKETSGLTGTPKFSGPGVSGAMTFNPGAAGPGTHTVRYTYTSNAGCSDFREESIAVNPSPIVDAGSNLTVLEGGVVTIKSTSTGTAVSTFSWSPPLGLDDPTKLTPVASPPKDTRYLLTATSDKGCLDTSSVFIKVLFAPVVPNTFTPNGDGINDRWEIKHIDSYPGAVLEVYNSLGQLVYRSNGYATPWDGTMNGRKIPAGTYYYVIDPKNRRQKQTGYITILY
jgi:gliding motility-associated-like protein